MAILSEFLLRLSWGLAFSMATVSAREVTSGYFRVHLWVVMGACTLAALLGSSLGASFGWPAAIAAVCSYAGSVAWLYEKSRPGKLLLVLVSGIALWGCWLVPTETGATSDDSMRLLWWLDPISGGLLIGSTLAAMLLGHWYLNNPSMKLIPLRRLILLIIAAIVFRAIVCGASLGLEVASVGLPEGVNRAFLGLRWIAGLGATMVLAVMALKTLRIPNTQSATGILYVAIITTFLGELAALLLSAATHHPL